RDRVLHLTLDFRNGLACRHAAWEVGRVGGEVLALGAFDHDEIAAFSHASSWSPACLMMDAHVFGCKVSEGLPATVTTPGRFGCLYWRWLPRVRVSSHPAASICFIACRTLTLGTT